MAKATDRLAAQSRVILWAGFGGLLLLMLFAGISTLQELRVIQSRTEQVQGDFVSRDRLLHEIRSDLYLSGTYVRDYLLEPDPENAALHLQNLHRVRQDMDAALARYAQMVNPSASSPFLGLNRALLEYWQVLDPVFKWTADARRERGPAFVRNELLPRRTQMLSIADQIAAVNERQLAERNDRVTDLYDSLRRRTVATVSVTLVLGLTLAGFSVRRILLLEREAGARFDEAKELSARLVRVQEDERRAISRELHDEVGQSLSALLVGMGNLSASVPPAAKSDVDTIRKLAETSVASVRNMALLLRPSMLDDLGLIPALEWQARETSRRTGLNVNVHADGVPDELPEEHKTCVYRVVQEALHNISRHAEAHTVNIDVEQKDHHLNLTVQDDGRGFDPMRTRGLGLIGIGERVANLGGSFDVRAAPGQGTRLAISLPMGAGQ